jgi:16S rRNA pseudouridine516 synthase
MPRLDRLLARNLDCARARARELIAAGQVIGDDGRTLSDARAEIAMSALPMRVRVDDDPIELRDSVYLMLNKPEGTVTALRDEIHPVAYDLLRSAPLHHELRAVGRLDLETTGLLLWTTDGTWLHQLTHPRGKIVRTYQAALARPYAPPPVELVLEDGHRPVIVDLATAAAGDLHPSLARPSDAATYATISVIGGAYHEVRRIFAALGSHVLALCRVGFGKLALPADLPPGTFRLIDPTAVRPLPARPGET